MRVDRIAPVIGGRDLDYGAIDGTHAAAARSNLDDGVFRDRIDHLALADLGIVGAAIDAVDQKIVSVFLFVGEAAHHDAADDRGRPRSGGVVDDALGR